MDAQQITQRICGVCPISHGLASVKSQEEAYGIEAPKNAQLIRNIMMAGDFIQNNITHFYHLSALDFIDIPGVLAYTGRDSLMLGIKSWVQEELKSNKLQPGAPFLPRFEGKYLQQYEGNLTAVRNYFTALDIRAKAHQLVAIFSGKLPHMATIVPGGVTERVDTKKIAQCRSKLRDIKTFYETAYSEDMLAIAQAFSEYYAVGKGCGNYLSFGTLPDIGNGGELIFPAGVVMAGNFSQVDLNQISEEVRYAKYSADSGFGRTIPDPNKDGAYSWIKAPRYGGKPMEVGPLARVMVAYQAKGGQGLTDLVDQFLQKSGRSVRELDSCMGRHVARYLETRLVIDHCEQWIEMLHPLEPTCVDFDLPKQAKGKGLIEAPRGALGHWIEIEDSKVASYECIVPTTWNCSPKDDQGSHGPAEQK
jgi:ferredoxin hydrogenase large subunit/hydrogenase large subunit